MQVIVVVAFDENRTIAKKGKLPWRIPAELAWFKNTTLGGVVILGRKTWNSLPKKPLPGRVNIVVTRNPSIVNELALTSNSLDEAIQIGNSYKNRQLFIIGGLEIYKQALLLPDVKILVSHIKGVHEGDLYFPELGPEWIPQFIFEHDKFKVVEYAKEIVETRSLPDTPAGPIQGGD